MPRIAVIVVALLVLVCGSTSLGQTSQPSAGLIVTRVDVWQALSEFERALRDHPLTDADRADVNRRFDEISVLIIKRRFGEAVRELHGLADAVSPESGRTPRSMPAKLARALRVRLGPSVSLSHRPTVIRVKISPLYAVPLAEPTALKLVIVPMDAPPNAPANPVLEREFEVASNGLAPVLTVQQPPNVAVGRYRVELVAPDGYRTHVATWTVADEAMELQRTRHDRRLAHVRIGSDQLSHALTAVSARSALLTDTPGELETVRYFTNPLELAGQLKSEIEAVEQDRDPFVDRTGDYWRTIWMGDLQAPARVYAPADAVASGKSLPLVIAVHGEAFDESMFLDGYGCGELKRQADRLGFIVVAPQYDIARVASGGVGSIVRVMSYNYLIDKKRVYAIGHSGGAIVVQKWAERDRDALAGVVMFAGATTFNHQTRGFPRALLVAGEVDALFKIDAARSIADDAARRRLPLELRQMPGYGHTLLVADALPAAIEWLLSKPGPTTPPATPPNGR